MRVVVSLCLPTILRSPYFDFPLSIFSLAWSWCPSPAAVGMTQRFLSDAPPRFTARPFRPTRSLCNNLRQGTPFLHQMSRSTPVFLMLLITNNARHLPCGLREGAHGVRGPSGPWHYLAPTSDLPGPLTGEAASMRLETGESTSHCKLHSGGSLYEFWIPHPAVPPRHFNEVAV